MTAKSKVFGVTQLPSGSVVPGGMVTVYNSGTLTPSTLFADSAGAVPKSNPLYADQYGTWSFFIAGGLYDIEMNLGGGRVRTLTEYAVC